MNILPRMLAIQARDTRYNGSRFRSRGEARWAVFFVAAGIKYWYECEDICVNGIRYLPDFKFPAFQMWVEIKPEAPTSEECGKAIRLCLAKHQKVCILSGIPGDYKGLLFTPLSVREMAEVFNFLTFIDNCILADNKLMGIAHKVFPQLNDTEPAWMSEIDALGRRARLLSTSDTEENFYVDFKWGYMCSATSFIQCPCCQKICLWGSKCLCGEDWLRLWCDDIREYDAPLLNAAYNRALSARFEYGESG